MICINGKQYFHWWEYLPKALARMEELVKEFNELEKTMTKQQQLFYQMTCLLDDRVEALTKRILSDPNDVSHKWYSELFKDFDWSEYEKAKAETQKQIDSICQCRNNI